MPIFAVTAESVTHALNSKYREPHQKYQKSITGT